MFNCTRKDIENGYIAVSVGYCNAQYLLSFHAPIARNYGVYGWNFDAFIFDNVAICTGYRNAPGMRVDCSEFEKEAEKIMHSNNYETKREDVEKVLRRFLEYVRMLHYSSSRFYKGFEINPPTATRGFTITDEDTGREFETLTEARIFIDNEARKAANT